MNSIRKPRGAEALCGKCGMLAPLKGGGKLGPHKDVLGRACRHRKTTWNGKKQ